MNYDYQVTGTSIVPPGQKLLLVAARKDDIEPRIEMLESAGLSPAFLDIDLFAKAMHFHFGSTNMRPNWPMKKSPLSAFMPHSYMH